MKCTQFSLVCLAEKRARSMCRVCGVPDCLLCVYNYTLLIFHKIAERIGKKNLHNVYVNLHALCSQPPTDIIRWYIHILYIFNICFEKLSLNLTSKLT